MQPNCQPSEPIAVVGLSCRLSGTASSQSGLWEMLAKGRSGWSATSTKRFPMGSFCHPKSELSGSFNSAGVHLINQDPAVFDNEFFGINGKEAMAMDPHQRWMLEVAYEAFENAGMTLKEIKGSNTAVYSTVPYPDYDQIMGRDPESSPGYRFTGTGPALMSNRISHFFDLRGPSLSIDTACSSSLVAVSEACKELQRGNIQQALVGGANLILDPDRLSVISSMQFLSPDGRCYSFDSRGNGYGRGEGVAAIVLKPLVAALRDGDRIRSVIRGTAVTSDGWTPGITMPSSDRQTDTIRLAYKDANLDPRETVYIEAHGTGTKVGDKAEVDAFRAAFFDGERNDNGLIVGSAKANLGHMEFVSGLGALIKVVLMLEKGIIPPNPTFKIPREDLALEKNGIHVPTKAMEWPKDTLRRASINSTGYGGTNAHVIVDAAEGHPIDDSQVEDGRPYLFILTHWQDDGLGILSHRLRRHLIGPVLGENQFTLNNLSFTLGSKRSHFPYRASIVTTSKSELIDGLGRLEKGTDRGIKAGSQPRVCFIFTGQGAQWPGMGRELIQLYPVFARSIYAAEEVLIGLGANWSLVVELTKPEETSQLNEARLAQPCTTAIQIALVDLLLSWGIMPSSVCGHSSGEIAAAYTAGILTRDEALRVAYFRGHSARLLRALNPHLDGGMLAVALSETDTKLQIEELGKEICIACINSPASVTLSGDRDALLRVSQGLDDRKIFNRFLSVDIAYHSSHMRHISEIYTSAISGIIPRPAREGIRMVSSVTGEPIQGEEMDPIYWTQNLLSPVRFSDALTKVFHLESGDEKNLVVEVGPHSTLRGPVLQIHKALNLPSPAYYLNLMKRGENTALTSLRLTGQLFCHGVQIDLDAVRSPDKRHPGQVMTCLPPYNWSHQAVHWSESRRSAAYRLRRFPRHDLLGTPVLDSIDIAPMWRNYLRISELPWLKGHSVDHQIVFPAAGYITMAIEALRQRTLASNRGWKNLCIHIRDVVINRPLLIPDDSAGTESFIQLQPSFYSAQESSVTWNEFRIFSCSADGASIEHCRGIVRTTLAEPSSDSATIYKEPQGLFTMMETSKWYNYLGSLGLSYSGPFNNLATISAQPFAARCRVSIPDVKSSMPAQHQEDHSVHPTTLDGCFQSILPGLQASGNLNSRVVITAIQELKINTNIPSTPGKQIELRSQIEKFGIGKYSANLLGSDPNTDTGNPLIQLKGLVYTTLTDNEVGGVAEKENCQSLCHQVIWRPDPFCCSPQRIMEYCRSDSADTPQKRLKEVCDPFCHSVINEILRSLSDSDKERISGYRKYLLGWMRAQSLDATFPVNEEAKRAVRAVGAVGEVVVQLGSHLRDILLGETDSLSVLLEDDLLHRVYFEDENITQCHSQLVQFLRLAKFKNPSLRILEIGAGTGSLALPIMEALYNEKEGLSSTSANWEQYVFTDISTGFMSRAREKLSAYERYIRFEKLDIESPAEEQGFDLGSFDFIVASNVVHATSELKKTLNNLRSLLKPGGQIAFMEITNPSLRWGFYGAIRDWWAGVNEGRVLSPLLSADQWDGVLRASGFSGVALEFKDYPSEVNHELSVLVSTAMPQISPSTNHEVCIVTTPDNSGLSRDLLHTMRTNNPGISVSQSQLSEAQPNDRVFIMLLEVESPFLLSSSKEEWESVRAILCHARAIIWVTRGSAVECSDPRRSLVTGLSRSLRSERHELKFITLDLDPQATSILQDTIDICQIYQYCLGSCSESEYEFAIRSGDVLIPRLMVDRKATSYVQDSVSRYHPRMQLGFTPKRSLALNIHTPGLLNSLYWEDNDAHSTPLGTSDVRVDFKHIALNFRDIMTAMGKLNGHSTLLIEGSGIVVEVGDAVKSQFAVGDFVCAVAPDGLSTVSKINAQYAFHIPPGLDSRSIAGLPIAYATALYSLVNISNLQPGDSILIHSAAGAVGQAAIAIARHLQADPILVTVGSSEKRSWLKKKFAIPDTDIYSSRDSTFGPDVLRRTNGRGVDIVLNSLSGDLIRESCEILAPFGRFVEIGKKDVLDNARLETRFLADNRSFAVVDLIMLAKRKPRLFHHLVQTALDLVQSSKVELFGPITVQPISEIEDSLRAMQKGTHMGKIVLDISPEIPVMIQPSRPKPAILNPDGTYVVVGGTGGIGRAIVRYLADLGAKHIITLSRSGGTADSVLGLIQEMADREIDLRVMKGSVVDLPTVEGILCTTKDHPVRGIIQAALILQDAPFVAMTYEQWREALDPRVVGTMNLEVVFKTSLDFFILLSSAVGILGTYGQGNYAAANTFLDAYARHRTSSQFPVSCIDVGLVSGEGKAAEHKDMADFMHRHGLRTHTINDLLALINHAIRHSGELTSSEAQILCGMRRPHPEHGTREAGLLRVDDRFSHIYSRDSQPQAIDVHRGGNDFQAALKSADTPKLVHDVAHAALKQKVSELLAIPEAGLLADRSVASYGVDSLISVELRNWVAAYLASYLEMLELMSSISMTKLADLIARRSRLVRAGLFEEIK